MEELENNLTYKECLFMTKNNNENEKVKMGKTPNKKIFIKSNEKKNINNKSNFNIIDVNNIQKNNNKKIIELEENHFKAVLYTQEIKKLKKNLIPEKISYICAVLRKTKSVIYIIRCNLWNTKTIQKLKEIK